MSYTAGFKNVRWIVLGDTVGYGADPNACFEWVSKQAHLKLMGNHEKAVVDFKLRDWFNPDARAAIEWTASVLDADWLKAIPGLPYLKIEADVIYTHSSPDDPDQFRYLLSFEDAEPSFRAFKEPLCFFGHTHIPSSFCEQTRRMEHLRPGVMHLDADRRYLINPGSVGQPRDSDKRLCFGVYDPGAATFEIVRLNYDNQKAAKKIRKAGLPGVFVDRLL